MTILGKRSMQVDYGGTHTHTITHAGIDSLTYINNIAIGKREAV